MSELSYKANSIRKKPSRRTNEQSSSNNNFISLDMDLLYENVDSHPTETELSEKQKQNQDTASLNLSKQNSSAVLGRKRNRMSNAIQNESRLFCHHCGQSKKRLTIALTCMSCCSSFCESCMQIYVVNSYFNLGQEHQRTKMLEMHGDLPVLQM